MYGVGKEGLFVFLVSCLDMMRHESAQTGHNHAVVVEQQYLNMSF